MTMVRVEGSIVRLTAPLAPAALAPAALAPAREAMLAKEMKEMKEGPPQVSHPRTRLALSAVGLDLLPITLLLHVPPRVMVLHLAPSLALGHLARGLQVEQVTPLKPMAPQENLPLRPRSLALLTMHLQVKVKTRLMSMQPLKSH